MAQQYPVKNVAYEFDVSLESQAAPGTFQAAPTLAAGDVKVIKDGGTAANITTLPTVTPSGGVVVRVQLSATEMDADKVTVVFQDVAGDEWYDLAVAIQPQAVAPATALVAIQERTDNLPDDPADQSEATADANSILAAIAALNDIDSTAAQAAAAAALAAYDPPTKAELDAGLAGLNDLDATAVQAAAAAALAAYDPPTNAEMVAALAALNDLSAAEIRTAIGLASANLDTQLAAIVEDTGTTLPATLATLATAASIAALNDLSSADVTAAVPTTAQIKTAIEAAGSHLALILEDTGTTLPATLAALATAAAVAALNDLSQAEAQAAAAAALTAYDPPTRTEATADKAEILADIATVDGVVDDILEDTAEIGVAGAGLTEAGGTGDHLTELSVDAEVAVDEAAIAAAIVELLGGATIVVQSPVRSNGDISIKAGNDYPAGKIVWNVTGASDMTGATVTFYRGDFSAPVTVSNQGEATQTFTLPLTRAQTAALAHGPMAFDVNALLATDVLETVIEGRAFVKPSAIVA
ncbi:hypothetical protein KDK88_05255 [bacterium]|nr:hypothetical protein [bacterium]